MLAQLSRLWQEYVENVLFKLQVPQTSGRTDLFLSKADCWWPTYHKSTKRARCLIYYGNHVPSIKYRVLLNKRPLFKGTWLYFERQLYVSITAVTLNCCSRSKDKYKWYKRAVVLEIKIFIRLLTIYEKHLRIEEQRVEPNFIKKYFLKYCL